MAGGILGGFFSSQNNNQAPASTMSQQDLMDQLQGIPYEDLAAYANSGDISSDKEDQDWYKYLQSQASGGTGSFLGKYGIYLIGAAVFVVILLFLNVKK